MSQVLIMTQDMIPSEADNGFNTILQRDTTLPLDTYYQQVLDWLTEKQKADPDLTALFIEQGHPLKTGPIEVFLPEDINGLMLQPACRTVDESGQVQFTDVSNLFSPNLIQTACQKLDQVGIDNQTCLAAAVAAPQLLSPAEQKALLQMEASMAITYLYLEARAARARNIPALGIIVSGEIDPSQIAKIITTLG